MILVRCACLCCDHQLSGFQRGIIRRILTFCRSINLTKNCKINCCWELFLWMMVASDTFSRARKMDHWLLGDVTCVISSIAGRMLLSIWKVLGTTRVCPNFNIPDRIFPKLIMVSIIEYLRWLDLPNVSAMFVFSIPQAQFDFSWSWTFNIIQVIFKMNDMINLILFLIFFRLFTCMTTCTRLSFSLVTMFVYFLVGDKNGWVGLNALFAQYSENW